MAEPPLPTTDFSGTWSIDDGEGNTVAADVRYSAANRAMRLEMSPGGMAMNAIRDMASGEVIMWTAQMPGMGMRIATPTEFEVDAEATGERQEVNGESCEIWRFEKGTACLAEGNVPLRTVAEGVTAELTELKREPQDAALFEPPADLNIINIRDVGGLKLEGLNLPNMPF